MATKTAMESKAASESTNELTDCEVVDKFFENDIIKTLAWNDISVEVNDRKSGTNTILSNNSGSISAGQVMALMGPSGSGKSTLLRALADRSSLSHTGSIHINGRQTTITAVKHLSNYVEQDDVQIGGLTVGETLDFAARLASPGANSTRRRSRNREILEALGLSQQQHSLVSPLLKTGLSGGQKRRLSLGTALVTGPKILFLDEPTSGLDSATSYQVMSFLSKIAKKYQLIVIASIHQPSISTFDLFDLVMLISGGRTCYCGPRKGMAGYFKDLDPSSALSDTADYFLDLVNTDFGSSDEGQHLIEMIFDHWEKYHATTELSGIRIDAQVYSLETRQSGSLCGIRDQLRASLVLLHRNFIKSYRDPLAYGTRLLINICLAIVIGTVWWKLPYHQSSISPFVNCLFFSSAFMALIAVAYAPPVIEDIRMLQKEYASGLYGSFAFVAANFLIGLPWLFLIALIFSTVVYWLAQLNSTGAAFMKFTLWLYADLLAAESMVVLIAALTPDFVAALAIISFANGLWLAVAGFLVPVGLLNAFWKNFQTYVFQGLMVNQFEYTNYDCNSLPNGGYHCMFLSDLGQEGKIRGSAVLEAFEMETSSKKITKWVGYTAVIILGLRFLGGLCLQWRAGRR